MRNIILSFLFFNLFIAFEAFSQTSDDYEKTFKYGTPSQKIAAISKIKRTKNEADIAMIANHYPEEMNSGVKSEIINFFKQNKNDNAKIIIEYAIEDENESVRKDAYYFLFFLSLK